MAHHKSAKKRIKTSRKENAYNKHYKTMVKTAVKKVRQATTLEEGKTSLLVAQSILDKLITKGVMKKNTVANQKSKLMKFVNGLSA